MNRRRFLTVAASASVLGGCSALGGGCGPGDTALTDIKNGSGNVVRVRGTVKAIDDDGSAFGIDDGTGLASVSAGTERLPDKGDCVNVLAEVSDCRGCGEDEYYLIARDWQVV